MRFSVPVHQTWNSRYVFVVLNVDAPAQENILNRKKTSCLPLVRPGFEAGRPRHPLTGKPNACSKTD